MCSPAFLMTDKRANTRFPPPETPSTVVSNRVRGRLVSPARYRKLFLDMLEDVKEPRKRDFLGEALVHQPRRFLREFARQTVKQLVWRAVGFQALDRMKTMKTAIAGRLSQHRAAL